MSEYSYEQYLADQETADTLDFVQNYMHAPYDVAERYVMALARRGFPSNSAN